MTKITQYNENIKINGTFTLNNGTQSNGYVLTSDSGGTASWQVSTASGSSSNAKFTLTTGFTSGVTVTVPHNLNTTDIVIQLKDLTNNELIELTVDNYSANTVDITSTTTLPSVRVIILGAGGSNSGSSGTDVYVTGGTFTASAGTATFRNNTGGTFSVTGFTTGSTNLSYATTTGLTSGVTYTIVHGLGTTDVVVQIKDLISNQLVDLVVDNYQTNNVDITSSITMSSARIMVLSAGGTGSGTGIISVKNTVFVSKNGNDATGLVERLDLPFSSITAAISAVTTHYSGATAPSATNRILIKVFSGYYIDHILLTNFVDFDFTNSVIDFLGGGITATIEDNNIACESIIYGNATILNNGAGLGCIYTQNANTKLTIYADSIKSTFSYGSVNQNGTQIIHSNISALAFNAWCLYLLGGTTTVYGNIVGDFLGAILDSGTPTLTVYGNISGGTTGVFNQGGNPTFTLYGDAIGGVGGGYAAGCSSGIQTINGNATTRTSPYAVACNGIGGSATQIFNNSRITSMTGIAVLQSNSGTTILNNCTLLSATKSIGDDSVVKIYGACQADKAVGTGTTQQVGFLTVDVNVV